jgi:putative oxidoreductase
MKSFRLPLPTATLVRWVLAGLFILAGLLKLRDPESFADSIAGFHLLSPRWINIIALGLPPMEILSGLLLLVPSRHRILGLAAILLMTSVFTLALTSALFRGLNVDCGCFGKNILPFTQGTGFALGRVVILLLGAAYLWRHQTSSSSAHTDSNPK